MIKRKQEYQLIVDRVSKALSHTPDQLAKWAQLSEAYIDAASDMTKDELALIEAYLKRDMHTFSEHYQQAFENDGDDDVFREVIANSLWEQFAKITDTTQLEWKEIFRDIEHHGVYRAGEVVGLGVLQCEQCGHQTQHYHVGVLASCNKCGCNEFSRKSFSE